jgi:hypothetical protein
VQHEATLHPPPVRLTPHFWSRSPYPAFRHTYNRYLWTTNRAGHPILANIRWHDASDLASWVRNPAGFPAHSPTNADSPGPKNRFASHPPIISTRHSDPFTERVALPSNFYPEHDDHLRLLPHLRGWHRRSCEARSCEARRSYCTDSATFATKPNIAIPTPVALPVCGNASLTVSMSIMITMESRSANTSSGRPQRRLLSDFCWSS